MRGVSEPPTPRGRRRVVVLLLILCCFSLALVAGSGVAAADDTESPEWGNATVSRGEPTSVNVTFYDDERVNRDSISGDDFELDGANVTVVDSITGISTDGNRSGIAVTLLLDSPLTNDNATLSFRPNGSIVETANSAGDGPAGIADEAGNTLTNGSVAIDFVGNDTGGPQWGAATRVEDTEINVTFYDNIRVDPSSINRTDFVLSSGRVANITSVELLDGGENRSGVAVHLLLERRVDENNVTVSFRRNRSIEDTDGNSLGSGSVTVTGMDSVVPEFERFELRAENASTVEVVVETSEPLSGIRMPVFGPVDTELIRADFTLVDNQTATYRARYTATREGTYRFVWNRATDRYGNFRRLARSRQFEYDDGNPNIVLDGVNNTTVGTTVNLSAAESEDDDGIASYQWRIDGGTILTGESIDVAFAVAGSHEVVVEVTDTLGNTSVARQQIRVAPANDSAVTLSRHNATYATARVDASGFVQQIRAAEGAVVGTENVSLTRLDASFPAQERVDLTFRATNATPSSLNGTGIGLFEIGHWNTTAEQVSLRFGVERAALNRTGADPGDVTLYRNASEWSALNTSVVSREDARVEYTADSPGLSQFAVSVTPEATNSANQTGNETVDNETVSGNETAANSTAGGGLSTNETTGGGASENKRDDRRRGERERDGRRTH